MASREIIKDVARHLWTLSGKTITFEAIDAWEQALKKYSDFIVIRAGQLLLENWTSIRVPQPGDLKALIPKGNEDTEDQKEFVLGIGTCQECGNYGKTIKEPKETGVWQCRECYTGLTSAQIKGKWQGLINIMSKDKDNGNRPHQGS